AVNFRTVQTYRTVIYRCPSRTCRVIDIPNSHPTARYPLDLAVSRTGYIRTVIIHIGIVNNRRAIVNIHAVPIGRIVAIDPRATNVALRHKYPMCGGNAHIYGDTHTWTKRCPAVIATAAAPAYPGR